MDLRNKKILVTGANGYIGRNLLDYLSVLNLNVIAVSRKFDKVLPNIKYIEQDIFSIENPYIFFGKPDVCIHLAWSNGFNHNSESHIYQLPLHFKFINNLISNDILKINIIGTMHEIGTFEGKIDNFTISQPSNNYGIAKDSLRKFVFALNPANLNWLRLFYIYGKDSNNPSVFGKLLTANKEGKEYFPINSGKNKYDFIYIDDLVKQITIASLQTSILGIINCCSGIPIALDKMLLKYIKINNLDIKLDYNKFPDKISDSKIIYGDNEIIKFLTTKNDYNT
jgi:dTDP-6-deoxy-L-talose 4-dehydrogenase (NAD+)